jgi:hypothetical protein
MNILFLTDSLGYPRVEPAGTEARNVWPYKTRDKFEASDYKSNLFFFDMKSGRHTDSLLVDVDNHIMSYEPNIIVLQVGIVDCYPRSLKMVEQQILTRIPLVRGFSKYVVKKFYKQIIMARKITYVCLRNFQNNLVELKSKFPGVIWIVLPIAPANRRWQIKNPLVKDNIDSYNGVLEKEFGSSYLSATYEAADIELLFLADNHHLSKYGHSVVSLHVSEKIGEVLCQ